MLSTVVFNNSKLHLGSKIGVSNLGDLVFDSTAQIFSATLDARFVAAADATEVQKNRIDAVLSVADVSADTLLEVCSFAKAVKDLEIGDVSDLLVKSEVLRINQKQYVQVEPCIDILADSSLPIKMHLTDSYKGWLIEKDSSDSKKVNLYFPFPSGLKVGDINSLYFKCKLFRQSFPFITIYTSPDTLTPNAAGWYKSKKTFDSDNFNPTIVANT